jgi:hypothetical protein
MWNVFEYPFVGIGLAIFSMIGLWIFGAFWPEKKRKWHFAIPFVIIGLAFAIAYLVQTDKEKIQNAVNKGIKAFQTQNIEPIKEIIADDYYDGAHSSKEFIIAYCQALFQTATVEKITIYSRQIEIEKNKATFTTEALVKFTKNSQMAQMGKPLLLVKARFNFKKTPDKNPTSPSYFARLRRNRLRRTRWLINSSEILELDRNPVNWNQLHN